MIEPNLKEMFTMRKTHPPVSESNLVETNPKSVTVSVTTADGRKKDLPKAIPPEEFEIFVEVEQRLIPEQHTDFDKRVQELKERLAKSKQGLLQVDWEILPPGSIEKEIARQSQLNQPEALDKRTERIERLSFLNSLGPDQWVKGKVRELGNDYFVALLGEVAVADSSMYGNALYVVINGNWQSVLSLKKSEARKQVGVIRIFHRGEWQDRLLEVLCENI